MLTGTIGRFLTRTTSTWSPEGSRRHVDGHDVVIGNRALLGDRDIEVPSTVADYVREHEGRGETVVHVVRDEDVIRAIAMRDELRKPHLVSSGHSKTPPSRDGDAHRRQRSRRGRGG